MLLKRAVFISVIVVVFLLFAGLVSFMMVRGFPALDVTAQAAILGALAGAVGGIVVSIMTLLGSLWTSSRDVENRLKDRVSNHALELTRMDYDLRQKSLDFTKRKRQFLAPIKVYRELYKALLELHDTGTWPDTINQLGLLQIFELGADDDQGEKSKTK